MSDVSFISAAPASNFNFERQAPAQSAASEPAAPTRARTPPPPAELPSKTKVMTEMRSNFQVAYTFIDPDTEQVVARWPVAPPLNVDDALGARARHTV